MKFCSMDVIIETERLLFRKFTLEDALLIYELNLDPEVIRYTFDPIKDLEHARQILEKTILPQYELYNHGRWAVLRKSDLEFLGWCGLKAIPETCLTGRQGEEIDLGYRFKKEYWGEGYATEAALACIKYGFETLNLKRIIGRAVPENRGSLNVLKKCGMGFVEEGIVDGYQSITYEIINPFIT